MTKKSRRVAKARRVLFTLSLVLVMMMVAVGGTIAWLTDTTNEIVNTFTPTGIKITLIETKNPDGSVNANGVTDWAVQLIPGMEYDKNPTVTVEETTNVDVLLFVKFNESVDENVLTYTSNLGKDGEGWTLVAGENDVWYRVVTADADVKTFELLDENKVSIADTITYDDLKNVVTGTMTYKAYAIQTAGFSTTTTKEVNGETVTETTYNVADAWDEVSALDTTTDDTANEDTTGE